MSEYWGDVLQSFQNGVQLDLRVKLAIEFLKSPAFSGDGASPEGAATRALTLAVLMRQPLPLDWTAQRRQLVEIG